MPTVLPIYEYGPVTYPVVETVRGGQLVEARVGGVGVAGATSLKVLGIARTDAMLASASQDLTDALGNSVLNLSPVSPYVAVGRGAFYPVTFVAAAAFGDKLIAAAAGKVTPAGAGPDAASIVGYCAAVGGVALGAVGMAFIF